MLQRTLRVEYDRTTRVLCVLGSELRVSLNRGAPPGSKFFSVKCTPGVQYHITPPPTETGHLSPMALSDSTMLLISMKAPSEHENDSKLSVKYYGEKKEELGMALLLLTAVDISLDVDADRDGIVEKNNPNKGSWKWGPDGHGAILLVNCDCERTYWKTPDHEDDRITRVSDLKDMSTMVLRTSGPAKLPDGYKLALHVSQGHAESIRVFRPKDNNMSEPNFAQKLLFDKFVKQYPLVLSSEDLSKEVPYLGDGGELKFYVEGLRFPDKDFDGLINIHLSLLEPIAEDIPKTPIFTETVVFRVAPWIMTPNTLRPEEVLVCSTDDNFEFLRGIETVVVKAGCKMRICKEVMNQGDRWMQDELEFGYIDSPHQQFPVVLDSPRDGSLQDFPYTELLGPDFGYVTREVERTDVSSLDSFGNLEVSPPVTVNGKKYPLGRILIGVAFPTATVGRSMTKVVQNFLWAQKVQEPVALYSDWLSVGHIDEFMSFVPAHDKKGFRLLLASPDAGYKLFRGLQKDGHGEAKLFEGVEDEETPKETVDEILKNKSLREQNSYVQSCVDWNRDVLKRELGLEEEDIIDLPILFKLVPGEEINRAVAYYPDMVNMIVLGKNLGIPKPFGPRVNGRCALEAEMCSLMGSLGLSCTFINNFESYHKLMGEVHCGSNVRRKPFDFKWWNMDM